MTRDASLCHYSSAGLSKPMGFLRPRTAASREAVVRLLLTGIHLMRTDVVNANLMELNEEARLPYIADLIVRKRSGENRTRRCRGRVSPARIRTPTHRIAGAA